MGLFNGHSKLSSIGIEVDEHEFRAVQLLENGRGLSTVAWAIFPRQCADEDADSALPGAEELAWARDILGRRGCIGDSVSLMVSSTQCSSHVLELPPMESGAPIEQIAKVEIARAKKCGPDDFEVGYWSMPAKGRANPETLAVACPKRVVHQMIERYEQAGFVPTGIDLADLAVPRGCAFEQSVGNAEIHVAVHIGWSSSLATLMLGDVVVYVRKIELGAKSAWDIARERFRLSVGGAQAVLDGRSAEEKDEAFARMHRSAWAPLATSLASEVDVAMGYVSHSYRTAPFGKMMISGYGYCNHVIEEQLDAVLGMAVEYATPPSLVEAIGTGSQVFSQANRLTAAYALAARFDR